MIFISRTLIRITGIDCRAEIGPGNFDIGRGRRVALISLVGLEYILYSLKRGARYIRGSRLQEGLHQR